MVVQGGRTRKINKFSMDMGYQGELRFFTQASGDPAGFQELFDSYAASTAATLKAAEALKTGETIRICP